jgi:dolichyl-diphosphooligosaccharide--protein glycosyltransferase
MQIPVVSWTPLKSMEQLGPLFVFGVYQILAIIDLARWQKGFAVGSLEHLKLRQTVWLTIGSSGVLVLTILMQLGHFGPISARVRGLFMQHVRTGVNV